MVQRVESAAPAPHSIELFLRAMVVQLLRINWAPECHRRFVPVPNVWPAVYSRARYRRLDGYRRKRDRTCQVAAERLGKTQRWPANQPPDRTLLASVCLLRRSTLPVVP